MTDPRRARRAMLAFLLALPAAIGLGLGVTGVTRLADGNYAVGGLMLAVGVGLIIAAMQMLRRINARAERG